MAKELGMALTVPFLVCHHVGGKRLATEATWGRKEVTGFLGHLCFLEHHGL